MQTNRTRRVFAFLAVLALIATLAVSATALAAGAAPTISSVKPTRGPVGSTVTITGMNFDGSTTVSFGGVQATQTQPNGPATQVTAIVPSGAKSGAITVTTGDGSATTATSFVVTKGAVAAMSKAPAIMSFKPGSGSTSTKVTITGKNFAGATAVTIGGVKAAFTVSSNSHISVHVPASATSGKIKVKTRLGTATSLKSFQIR